jgi:predicted phage terminase large subunit-like protein
MIQVTPEQRDAIYRFDFYAFVQAAAAELEPGVKLEPTWHHEAIATLLVDSIGKKTRVFINAPPRSYKSIIVSVCWVAWVLGREPTHKFICASYSRDLAEHLGALCRRLMQSEFYHRVFSTRLAKVTDGELVTTAGGFRYATSVGATVTGFGAYTLIIDDPLSANDAYSAVVRNSQKAWFTGTLLSRLDKKAAGGAIFVVSQRLHQDDLTGMLIEHGWEGLVLPAIAPRDTVIKIGKRDHLWKMGEPLQAREPLDVLEDLKRQMMAAAFAAQYLQDPMPETGNMLDPAWLKQYDQPPVRQPEDEIVLSVDTALTATAASDYSACPVFLVRNRNQYYLIDVWRDKVNFIGLQDAIMRLTAQYKPHTILIEEHAAGRPLIDQLRHKGVESITGWRPTTDKATRMYAEITKLKDLYLPKSAPWKDAFMREYLSFPGGKHDDQIDALSQFLNWRTEAERRTSFSWDMGDGYESRHGAQLGAPPAEQICWWLKR